MQAQFVCVSPVNMRINTISSRKASFSAIWKALPEAQRSEARRRLIAEVGITDITLYRWREGKTAPRLPFYRSTAARIMSEVSGRQLTAEELFPTLK